MTLNPSVVTGVMMSTWSLFEAACYVHNLDPKTIKQPFSVTATSKPAKTYHWLAKELDRHRIFPSRNEDSDEIRFIPGTIMRHMIEKKKGFHKPVLTAYDKYGVSTGPSDMNDEAKRIYRHAGAIIRRMHPSIRKTQAALLLMELPSHLEEISIPSYGEPALRRHLIGLWPAQPGRPPKGESELPEIDWTALVKELI